MSFSTADGRFAETWSLEMDVAAFEPEAVHFLYYQPAADFHGALAMSGLDEVSYAFNFQGVAWSGEVVTVTRSEDEMATECGIGAWNQELRTSCGE